MNTLYRPVLIETAEQAEALPEGTIISYRLAPTVLISDEERVWVDGEDAVMTGADLYAARDVWAVLAPIEAEEEKRSVARHSGGGQTNYNTEAAGNPGRMGEYIASLPVESRYVTPWESV